MSKYTRPSSRFNENEWRTMEDPRDGVFLPRLKRLFYYRFYYKLQMDTKSYGKISIQN